jgi:spore maturation protein CgeB
MSQLNCVFLGLTISSTWGNGHATTYRALLKYLSAIGHKVTFLERDMPWYASNRELDRLPYCDLIFYQSLDELKQRYLKLIRNADVVVVGSYVPDGIEVGRWVTRNTKNLAVFYDIDTPITLANLLEGRCEYLSKQLICKYNLYLSFTGGPLLEFIEEELSSPCARALYCSVDPELYFPECRPTNWDMAYLGTYAEDRQPALAKLLLCVASKQTDRQFAIAGPQYPAEIVWPENVRRIEHLPATDHRIFYNSQRFTLNLTRRNMVRAGYSPSVRLFEAAACGTPIISDIWPGLGSFFDLGSEILPVRTSCEVTSNLLMGESRRLEIAERARLRTLREHTAEVRAHEFERYVRGSLNELCRSAKKERIVPVRTSSSAALI